MTTRIVPAPNQWWMNQQESFKKRVAGKHFNKVHDNLTKTEIYDLFSIYYRLQIEYTRDIKMLEENRNLLIKGTRIIFVPLCLLLYAIAGYKALFFHLNMEVPFLYTTALLVLGMIAVHVADAIIERVIIKKLKEIT